MEEIVGQSKEAWLFEHYGKVQRKQGNRMICDI